MQHYVEQEIKGVVFQKAVKKGKKKKIQNAAFSENLKCFTRLLCHTVSELNMGPLWKLNLPYFVCD